MSLKTRSAFIYGHTITDANTFLNFSEDGVTELTTTVDEGAYTLTEFVDKVAQALNEVGNNEYTVTVDRTTRLITISADANFSLLVVSGTQSSISVWDLLGFNADQSGSDTYTASLPSGDLYLPQGPLYDYIPSENIKEVVQSERNESSSGDAIEVISYGVRNYMECEIKYATDIVQPTGKKYFLDNNPNGVADLRRFLDYVRTVAPIEFIPNRDDFSVFESFIIERTDRSRDGTGFQIRELYAEGLADYFSSGRLIFRRV